MLEKAIKCGLIGGLILFIWSAVSWSLLPWQKSQMKSFTNEVAVRNAIGDNMNGSGLYVMPNLHQYAHQPAELENAKIRMQDGPYAFIAVMANGRNPNMAGYAIGSLIIDIIAVCLATWMLIKSSQLEYMKVIKFFSVIGIIIGLLAGFPYVFWFGFPVGFAFATVIEMTIGWFFASLGVTKILHLRKKG